MKLLYLLNKTHNVIESPIHVNRSITKLYKLEKQAVKTTM